MLIIWHRLSLGSAMISTIRLYLVLKLISMGKASSKLRVIPTRSGQVLGILDQTLNGTQFWSFRSIPFAKPPIQELRFADPEPIEPWTNIFDGRQDGPSCPQIPALFEDGVKGDEDCLWLSVFTKFLPGDRPRLEPRPVLIWIHGGRWVIGSAQTSLYSPDYLLEHELVIVHLQYRLGALGYLSTEDSVAPGNYGLKDQVVALKWIKNNIEDFGGDPKQITIMGHSAGAASAHAHVLSPMSRGLFQRAISLSGTANNFWAFRTVDQESVAKRQAKLLNCPTKGSKALIQCLRRVDFRSLTSSQADLYDLFPRSEAKLPLSPTVPRIDVESPNPFLALDPLEHLRSGDFDQHIPWMTGLTSQEGSWYSVSLFGSKHQQRLAVANFNQRQTLQHMTRAPTISQAHEFERIMVQVFGNQSFQSEKHRIAGAEFFSDLLFNAEVLQAIYLQSIKSKSSVYFHRFDYMGGFGYTELFGDKQAHHGGVAHLDDIRYVMRLPWMKPITAQEWPIVQMYTQAIANFAASGNPNRANQSEAWKPFSPMEGNYNVFNERGQMEASTSIPFPLERLRLWKSLFKIKDNFENAFNLTCNQ